MEFTDLEFTEAGVNKEAFEKWGQVMQALWEGAVSIYYTKSSSLDFFPQNVDNEILVGGVLKISAAIVNHSYIEVSLHSKADLIAEFRSDKIDVQIICICIALIINDLIS
jgi:hypothetical protein